MFVSDGWPKIKVDYVVGSDTFTIPKETCGHLKSFCQVIDGWRWFSEFVDAYGVIDDLSNFVLWPAGLAIQTDGRSALLELLVVIVIV